MTNSAAGDSGNLTSSAVSDMTGPAITVADALDRS
jgi:hypothetical protein